MRIIPSRPKTNRWQASSPRRFVAVHVIFTAHLIAVLLVGNLAACDVCLRLPGVPFEVDHPAAIEVAMATQEAAERGQIEMNPLVKQALASNRHLPPRLDTISPRQLVALWSRTRPAQRHPSLRFTMELVFVDTDGICPLDIRFGDVLDGDCRNGPPSVRIFTTKAGFYRLIEDGLETCERRKLVAVEFEDLEQGDGLRQLFAISTNLKNPTALSSL